ncbi:MAG: GNAT family N-acetyltransferase [Brevundimonas sp.]|nr:GNAT family N-acetyltransferase [Brevundimonas sp.]
MVPAVRGAATAGRLADLHAQAFDAPWGAKAFDDLLDQSGVFALEAADGFILMRVVADEAEILTLAVRPAARQAGLGLRLVEQACVVAVSQGATRLFLEVADDNVTARALYAKAGFTEAGRRAGYYGRRDGSRVDALVLTKTLSQPLP